MKHYKTTQIVLQTLSVLAFLVALTTDQFEFARLEIGYYGYFVLGGLQVIDSFVNRAERDRISWLADRKWHFIYLGIIVALFLPSLLTPGLALVPFVVLLFTSPLVALFVFVSIVRERIRAGETEDTEELLDGSNLFL